MYSLDGLFWSREWTAASVSTKLEALANQMHPVFAAKAHLAGVVVTNGAALVDLRQDEERAAKETGAVALRQPVPPVKHREVYVLPAAAASATATSFWTTAYGDEPTWLDWALTRERLPKLAEVFAAPAA